MKKLLLALLLLLLMHPAMAVVDLLNPIEGNVTSNTTINFEYYVSMENLSSCTAYVGGSDFLDTDAASNEINAVQIQGMLPGTYQWNISCSGAEVESSVSRTFTIDTQPPTIAIATPANGTVKNIALDIIPNDETSLSLACNVQWKDEVIDSFATGRNVHFVKNYTGSPGNGTLRVSCADGAGNIATQERFLSLNPDFGLQFKLDKHEYGLGEPVKMTINTIPGANVSIDICPDQAGFVQCTAALLGSSAFPQTITLPYMNKTGGYLVAGISRHGGQTRANQTRFNISNTITAVIQKTATPKRNSTINLTANIDGGIPPYRTSWRLHDGRVVNDLTTVSVSFPEAGDFNETLIVTDNGGNNRTATTTIHIDPVLSVLIKVVDNQTGAPLRADLDIGNREATSGTDGVAYFELEPGTYQIFASAQGYQYTVEKRYINTTGPYQISMAKAIQQPVVALTSPANSTTVPASFTVSFTAQHPLPLVCTIYEGSDNWFKEAGRMDVTSGALNQMAVTLTIGVHEIKVECSDGSLSGSSQSAFVTVQGQEQEVVQSALPTTDEAGLQQISAELDAALGAIDAFGPKEREVLPLLLFEKNLRSTKKLVQQAIRDVSDLQFRNDIGEEEKQAQRMQIIDKVQLQLEGIPLRMSVTDTNTFVKYVKADTADAAASALANLGGLGDAASIKEKLLEDQQKFTMSAKAWQVTYTYRDGKTKELTLVQKTFTYAPDLDTQYALYEIIPKSVAKSARELTLTSKAETLNDDPVLRFQRDDSISYIIPKKVEFSDLATTMTVLTKPHPKTTSITGYAIFTGGDISGMGTPAIILVATIVLLYLAYYFNLHQKLTFLLYKIGRKEKVHYLRVLMNDVTDHLASNNYEKADMLYKEIRLTYDTLPTPAKNDLYEDIIELVKKMDSYYFNLIMIELDANLKAGHMEEAIYSYEKLTGTFERLDPDQQQQLIQTVTGMAKRIGLEVAA